MERRTRWTPLTADELADTVATVEQIGVKGAAAKYGITIESIYTRLRKANRPDLLPGKPKPTPSRPAEGEAETLESLDRFIGRQATKYNRGVHPQYDEEDLKQEGLIAAIRLLRCGRHDSKKGNLFTFAKMRIAGGMADFARGQSFAPRVALQRDAAGVEQVRRMVSFSAFEKEFRNPSGGRGQVKTVRIDPAHAGPQPCDDPTSNFIDLCIQLFGGMSNDEHFVMVWYYIDGMKFTEIGYLLGLSQSRISQIHSEVISRCRIRHAWEAHQ